MSKEQNKLFVGLDIGTTKIAAIVGRENDDGGLDIVGLGTHPSHGLKKGVVINIDSTVESIQRAIEEAELMVGCQIESVSAGITGSHVECRNSNGIVAIRDKEVTQADIDRVIDAAKAIVIPSDQQILHIIPQEFIIDYQEGIKDPLGMSGIRLEVKVHIITGATSAVQNIINCVKRCGLRVEDVVLEQLASSYAVLTKDERDLGVCLVDIGGGTSDIAVFTYDSIRHTGVIPIAGDQVTNDIAIGLRTPHRFAEELKIKYACALTQLASFDETIKVPSIGERGERRLARQMLVSIVEPRYVELLTLILKELRRSGLDEMVPGGIVLTGGGSKMEGLVELAEEVFHMSCRVGGPYGITGLTEVAKNPIFSTAVGLLEYARLNQQKDGRKRFSDGDQNLVEKMKQWFTSKF